MEINPDECDWEKTYRLISSIVAPRPIGWISSMDKNGEDNLAPYSNYNKVSSDPPVVMFSAGTQERATDDGEMISGMKTTPQNVIETKEFVVNLVTEDLLGEVDRTSAAIIDGNKFDLADVERAPAKTVSPPRVADAKACLECTVHDIYNVYDYTMVLGDVQCFYVHEDILTDGDIDMTKIHSVGRLGGPYFTNIDIFSEWSYYDDNF